MESEAEFDRLIRLHELAEADPTLWPEVVTGWEALGQMIRARRDRPTRARIEVNLANGYLRLYEQTNHEEWANRAELLLKRALRTYRRGNHPEHWATIQHSLGVLNLGRYERTGAERWADRAQQSFYAAVRERPPGASPLDRAASFLSLGNLYLARYEQSGANPQARMGETHYRAALEIYRQLRASAQCAVVRLGLGNLHLARYERTGDAEQAREADRTLRAALRSPLDVTDRALIWHALATLCLARYERTGDPALVGEAERHFQAVLGAFPFAVAPSAWAMARHNLGTLHARLYEWTGDPAEAMLAEEHYTQALRVRRAGDAPMEWAMTQHSLGSLAVARYERTGEEAHADAAERFYRRALEIYQRTRTPTHRATAERSLATLLLTRYERRGYEADARRAERHLLEVLGEHPRAVAPLQWAITQHNLGSLSLARYERTGREVHARRSEAHYREALSASSSRSAPAQWATVQHSFGILRARQFERTGHVDAAREAARSFQSVRRMAAASLVPTVYGLRATASLLRLRFRQRRWTAVADAYQASAEALELLYGLQVFRGGRAAWLAETEGVPQCAAYALAGLGRLEQAVLALEHGRARLLGEALDRDRASLETLQSLEPVLAKRFEAAARRLSELETHELGQGFGVLGHAELVSQLRAARASLENAILSIRAFPGYADFLARPTVPTVSAAAREAPLVFLAATLAGGLGLIVWADGYVEHVPLPDLTAAALDEQLWGAPVRTVPGTVEASGYLRAYGLWRSAQSGDGAAQQAWLDALDRITAWLWAAVVRRLLASIERERAARVVLVPTGLLGLLPLHGAWVEDCESPTGRRYTVDAVAVTYAPSARALAHAQHVLATVQARRLLAVSDPRPARSAGSLLHSPIEVAAVATWFDNREVLEREGAALGTVLTTLATADVAHFSCHGQTDLHDPLRSGLLLAGDEWLAVADLLRLPLRAARLATLSSCETGFLGTKLPDEVVALPAGFLQAGFAGVVATLWSVSELSTAMLMERFYRLWRVEGLEPAAALREAQRWLRDTTNAEKAAYFARCIPSLVGPAAGLREIPEAVAAEFYVQAMSRAPDARTFAHPFWWAAFSLNGT